MPGGPDFEIVFLRWGKTQVAAAHQEDAIRKPQLLEESLRIVAELVEFDVALFWVHPLEQFYFVKLVQAVEAADVFAVAARFATEARRVGATADRQRGFLDDFIVKKFVSGVSAVGMA